MGLSKDADHLLYGTYIFDYQTNTVLEENAIDKQMAAEFIASFSNA
ncbi:hypothetical protein OK016_26310 [Vibrio chagasii]|nr:hypothetical protein [Vibrio chagasii]